ncbi:MAG: hypothetical protein JO044_02920 [Mycobacteriaceae bacterium]|nr:hypothetical protein [Mycobacteriaceae bacterium]MBV9641589.1 hypothetical protein [Mycobacteriaceae bacterium]
MTKPQYEPHPLVVDTDIAESGPAVVEVRLDGPAVIVVGAEFGASTGVPLMHRVVPRGRQALMLEATDLGFLAVQGLGALLVLCGHGGRAGAAWARATGPSISGLLRTLVRRDVRRTVALVAEVLREAEHG